MADPYDYRINWETTVPRYAKGIKTHYAQKPKENPMFHESDLKECQPELYKRIEELEKNVNVKSYTLIGSELLLAIYIILDQFVL